MTKHRRIALLLALPIVAFLANTAYSHFHTFIPDGGIFNRKGQEVTFNYFWGHPYEKILFETPKPDKLYVVNPDGTETDFTDKMAAKKEKGEGGEVTSYTFKFTPKDRGDYMLCLNAPAIFVEEEELFWQDYMKQVVHVQTQHGWDAKTGQKIELVPLVRPYGIEEGFVFRATAYLDGKPLADAEVEIEKYNPKAPHEEDLPDESMITRVAKTDANGVVAYTLDEPGWWVVCVSTESGEMEKDGKKYPLIVRGGFWLHVEEKFTQKIR